MDRKSVARTVIFTLPLFALVIGAGAITFETRQLSNVQSELNATRQEVASARNLINEMEGQKSLSRYPTAAMTPTEQPYFLNSLRTYAELNHVELVRWSSAPIPGKNDPAVKALPADVTPLVSSVELDGRYADLRAFLYDLLKSPRLVNMTDMKWSRGFKGPVETLTFTLTRYVVPPGKDAASVASTAAGVPAKQPFTPINAPSNAMAFKPGVLNAPDSNAASAVKELERTASPKPNR
jgi:Tfp pilus assembly protein PilO